LPRLRCAVAGIRNLSEHVKEIRLQPVDSEVPAFRAGQYLKVVHPHGDEIPYSIANAPGADVLELHYQPIEGTADARLMNALLGDETLDIVMPFGDCVADRPLARPLVITAAATGYAQARSVLEDLLTQPLPCAVHLYWGAQSASELYDAERLAELASATSNFHFHAVAEAAHDEWEGRRGTVARAIREDFSDLSTVDLMLCGGPSMVYATFDALTEIGLVRDNARSDVFSYAPRD
jgi:NAD(P)H-flavin reductase